MQKFKREFLRRQAARLALPVWLRILMPVTFLGTAFSVTGGLFWAIIKIRLKFRPEFSPLIPPPGSPPTAAFALVSLGAFIFAVCLSIVISNLLVGSVPAVRGILDKNAEGVPGGSFEAAMSQGWKAIAFVGLPCLALALVAGFFL
jgi:hypothetical protein